MNKFYLKLKSKKEQKKGLLLIEVVLVIAIFALLVTGIFSAFIYGQKTQINASKMNQATSLGKQTLDIVRGLRGFIFSKSPPNCPIDSPCGLIKNSDTSWSFTNAHKYLSFDGSSYLTMSQNNDFNFRTGNFSIDTWVYSTNLNGCQRIIGAGDNATSIWSLGIGNCWRGQPAINFFDTNSGYNYNDYTSDSLSMDMNTWYHVAVVKQGDFLYEYFNGKVVGTFYVSGVNFNSDNLGAIIGARYNQGSSSPIEYFSGRLDQLKIWKRALSSDEVKNLYNYGQEVAVDITKAPFNNSLVAGYSTDLNSGANTVSDFSGHGNIATLIGNITSGNDIGDNFSGFLRTISITSPVNDPKDSREITVNIFPNGANNSPLTFTTDLTPWSMSPTACLGTPSVTIGAFSYPTIKIGTQCWLAKNLNVGGKTNSGNPGTFPHECFNLSQTEPVISCQRSSGERYCYNNSVNYCKTYGGLYEWSEAMGLPYDCNNSEATDNGDGTYTLNCPTNSNQMISSTQQQGICPSGWHIPTQNDWLVLTSYLGGQNDAGGKMKQAGTKYWNQEHCGYSSCNTSGFTGLPGGVRSGQGGSFIGIGNYETFWSSTPVTGSTNSIYSYSFDLDTYGQGFWPYYDRNRASGFSVRCIKN